MSKIEVNEIVPQSGTTLTLGGSGDTLSIASGVTSSFPSLTVTGDLTVDTNLLKVDSTNNNVGIGTASPNNYAGYTTLTLNNSSTGNEIDFEVAGTVKAYIEGTGSILKLWSASGSDIGFYPNASQLMTLTSSGRVGIGTASPTRLVDLSTSTGGTIIHMTDDATGHLVTDGVDIQQEGTLFQILNREAGDIRLGTNSAECMRIDSSGNVLVSTTDTTPSENNDVSGISLRSNGQVNVSVDGGAGLDINRKTSDGQILRLRKGGVDVGSIGSATGGTIFIDGGSTYAGLQFGGNGSTEGRIVPRQNGVIADNKTNLGTDTYRFKDAYLSGNIYLGGTGSANALDDYEEGTWTPNLTFANSASGSLNYTQQEGMYVKVGRLVHVSVFVAWNANNFSANSGSFEIQGLPFVNNNNSLYRGGASITYSSGAFAGLTIYEQAFRAESSQSKFRFNYGINTGGNISSEVGSYTNIGNSGSFMISGTYQTN